MSTSYRLDVFTSSGVQLPSVVPIAVEYVLTERGVGTLKVTLPPSYPIANLQKDGLLRLNRDIGAGFYLEGDATWIIRRRQQSLEGRERLITVWAQHANNLLDRRIVAYAAGSAEASKSDAGDDMIKALVRENFTAPTDTTRTMTGLSVESDQGLGPTIDKSFSRRNVLTVAQDICDDAAAQGVYLGFEVRTIGTALTLVTYTSHRGVDRRYGSGNYLPVPLTSGAIAESSLDEDWSDEETFIYALGKGEQAERSVGTAQNTAAEGSSPYGRIEGHYQVNSTDDQDILDGYAQGELYARRGRVRYEARGQDAPGFIYGLHYRWGDLLTINDYGQQFDVRVDPVRVSFGRNGEQLDIRFVYDNTGLAL
jgi:hypothetical protein